MAWGTSPTLVMALYAEDDFAYWVNKSRGRVLGQFGKEGRVVFAFQVLRLSLCHVVLQLLRQALLLPQGNKPDGQ